MDRNRYMIKVSGPRNIPIFLTKLKSVGIKITALRIEEEAAIFRTDKKGLKQVRKYRKRYGLKVAVRLAVNDRGLDVYLVLIALLSFLVYRSFVHFFLWSVKVESDMPEVAERIEAKLQANMICTSPLFLIPDEGEMRRDLMQDDPALSWVRFKRTGASLTVIPMLSPKLNDQIEKEGSPSDLVARTGGVLTRFALTKGERVGHVYTTVKKGDVLASGTLEQGEEHVVVGAEGAVYADYWIEYKFSIPKVIQYKVQGEEKVEFIFHPPWKEDNLFTKEILNIVETKRTVSEADAQLEISEGMEETVVIPLLEMKLLAELGADAIIKDDKILHVTFDNDKVNGTVLFLINDNIAVKRPISQGD